MSGTPVNFPNTIADRAAGLAWSGYMQRWAARTATIAGFDYTGTGTQRRLYVPLATASLAGAMSAADFARLAALGQVRLAYVASTDLASGLAIAATTWTTIGTAQNFTVGLGTSYLLILVAGAIQVGNAASAINIGSQLLLDGSSAQSLGAGFSIPAAAFGNALQGAGGRAIGGVSAGTHSVAVQVFASANATAFCRANSSTLEKLTIAVIEVSQ